MNKKQVRPSKPSKLDASDPRLVSVRADGKLRAEQAFNLGGWRRAPAQSPVCCDALKGAPIRDALALLNAWNDAYHGRLHELEGGC